MTTRATDILSTAAKLVGGDRERTHGDKVTNFQSIAALWNAYLLARILNNRPPTLSAEDVAHMMSLMKKARTLSGSYNPDDYVDDAGYAGCAGEIASRSTVPAS
jgi:hypothetical protein